MFTSEDAFLFRFQKPLYARNQVAPKVSYYGTPSTWWRQELKPAPVIEDTGVSISSVGSPTAGTTTSTLPSTVANENVEVRQIPQEVTVFNVPEPVAVAPTQRPISAVIISDNSDEDVQVIQEIATPTPLRQTPIIILEESNANPVVQQVQVSGLRGFIPPPTPARPATSVVVLDNSDEDLRLGSIQQLQLPLFAVPAAASVSTQPAAAPLPVLDDSVEDIRIVQQVQVINVPVTRPRTTTLTPLVANTVGDLVLRDTPQEITLPSLSGTSAGATRPQPQTISLAISNDSDEEILQQVLVSNAPVSGARLIPTATPAVSLLLVDDSGEDLELRGIPQLGSGSLLTVPNPGTRITTQSISISDNSEEDFRIVQGVPVSNVPVSQSTGGTASLAVRNQGVPVSNVSVSPLIAGTASLAARNQRIPVSNVPVSQTTAETASLAVRNQQVPVFNVPVSQSTAGTASLAVRNQGVPATNVPVSRPRLTMPETVSFVVLDTSDEQDVLRVISQEVSRPLSSTPMQIGPLTVFDDSVEDVRIVQQVPVSNVQVPRPSTGPGVSFVILDRSNEDVQLRNTPQETMSFFSGSASAPTTRAPTLPLVLLDNSEEDLQIVRQGPLFNGSLLSSLTIIRENSFEVPDNSNEDFELRLIPQAVSVPTLSSPGPPLSTTTPLVLFFDSDEDIRTVQELRLPNISSSGGVVETPLLFLRDSGEDIQITRRIPQPTVSLTGSPQSAVAGSFVRLVDSAEDIQLTQEIRLPNISSSVRVGESPLIFLRDSGEDIEISRRIPQPTTSLSGSLQSAAAGPLVRLVDSDEDIQIAQEIRLPNSSGSVGDSPLIFLRDSGEDIEISRRIPQPTVSLPGSVQPVGAAPFIRLLDSDEDIQLAREVPLSSVRFSTPVTPPAQTPIAFQVDSDEDIQIVQGNLFSSIPLNGPAPTDAGTRVLLVDSAEDTQGFIRNNVSLSSTTTTGVVLFDSDEDIQSSVLPLLQAANRVQIQERELDDDRSDEEIRRRITILGESIVLVNSTAS